MSPGGALTLALAAALAALMGRSIQRGATCVVAAVDELVARRRASRLVAMAEASAWVGGGVLVLVAVGWPLHVAAGGHPGLAALGGGVLLGLGAWVNRACVFGAVARFASGDPAYLLTPVGFFAGCVAFHRWPPMGPAATAPAASGAAAVAPPLLSFASMGRDTAIVLASIVVVVALARVALAVRRAGGLRAGLSRAAASPHAATVTIGVAFLALLVLAGPWAYTDVLADWANGRMTRALEGGTLLVALFAGAAWGGRASLAGWRTWPARRALARCLAGGVLMGWGSQWIPGGNDGLLLLGLPLGEPHAALALVAMGLSIAGVMTLSRGRSSPSPTLRGSVDPAGPSAS